MTDVVAVELVIGIASIHFVNLSTATSRCVCPPGDDFLSGPTISSPHWANGHVNGMVLSADAGAWGFAENFWHPMHLLTVSSASLSAVGQLNPALKALATSDRLPARCPQVTA